VSVPVSRLAKYKTAAQMLAIFLLLLGPVGPAWFSAALTGKALLWLAALLTLVTGYAYLRTGWKHM
jgi:phosphatidylglycerophosphate synthase